MQSTRKVQARLVSRCLCRCGCVEDAVQQIVKKPSFINKHISDMFWHFPYYLRSDLARWKGQITSGNPFQRCQRGRVVWPHSQEADVYGCVIGVIDNFTTSYNFTILTYTYYTYSTSLHIAYYWLLLHTLGATHWNQNRSGPHRRPKLRRIVARAWKDGDREREKRVERCWKMLKDVESLRIFLPRQQL